MDSTKNASVERLTATSYADIDDDFVRFRDVPLDENVKSIVAGVVATDASGRDDFRSQLDTGTTDTLRLYAKRDELKKRLLAAIANDDGAMEKIMETLTLPAALKV